MSDDIVSAGSKQPDLQAFKYIITNRRGTRAMLQLHSDDLMDLCGGEMSSQWNQFDSESV